MRLSTPPRLSANLITLRFSKNVRASAPPPLRQNVTIPPKPFICFFASSCCGWEASPSQIFQKKKNTLTLLKLERTRIDNALYFGMLDKPIGNFNCVFLMFTHANVKGLHSSRCQEAIEGTWNGSNRFCTS